jgi:hypothetical protein
VIAFHSITAGLPQRLTELVLRVGAIAVPISSETAIPRHPYELMQ